MKIYSFGYKYESGQPESTMTFDLRNKIKNPVSHLPKGAIAILSTFYVTSQKRHNKTVYLLE